MELILAGVASALGFYVILLMLDIRKVCGYHVWWDIAFSAGLLLLYQGTFSGMVTAFVGGLSLSLLLAATKYLNGFKRRERGGWYFYPRWTSKRGYLGEG